MAKVSVESSYTLSSLNHLIYEVKSNMQDNLNLLNKAFAVACESWQDKNAQACDKALREHNEAMRAAFGRLEDFENAMRRLSNLTENYENI